MTKTKYYHVETSVKQNFDFSGSFPSITRLCSEYNKGDDYYMVKITPSKHLVDSTVLCEIIIQFYHYKKYII